MYKSCMFCWVNGPNMLIYNDIAITQRESYHYPYYYDSRRAVSDASNPPTHAAFWCRNGAASARWFDTRLPYRTRPGRNARPVAACPPTRRPSSASRTMTEQRKCTRRRASATIFVASMVGLVTTIRPVYAQDRPLTADFRETYRVGGLVAPEWALFAKRGDLGFDASGNLYVLDEEAFRVVVINPAGELVMTVGQKGEGPGCRAPSARTAWSRSGRWMKWMSRSSS